MLSGPCRREVVASQIPRGEGELEAHRQERGLERAPKQTLWVITSLVHAPSVYNTMSNHLAKGDLPCVLAISPREEYNSRGNSRSGT